MEKLALLNQINCENDLKKCLNLIDEKNGNELKTENVFDEEFKSQISNFQKTILQKQKQIEFLQESKNFALKNFNLLFAQGLNEKIKILNDDIEKTKLEINQKKEELILKKAQEKDEAKHFDLNNKSFEEVEEFGSLILNEKLQKEKYDLALNFFKNSSKSEALNFLLNDEFYLKHLGFKNLAKLLMELK